SWSLGHKVLATIAALLLLAAIALIGYWLLDPATSPNRGNTAPSVSTEIATTTPERTGSTVTRPNPTSPSRTSDATTTTTVTEESTESERPQTPTPPSRTNPLPDWIPQLPGIGG
ncbi:MAG: serine/threonine protein kinase, partial [Gordonia sp. (in: high G+C Gram-positive bacteria)]